MKGIMKAVSLKNFAALALGIALSACATTPVVPTAKSFTHTITVQLAAGDTQASLQQKYGGEVVVFNQDLGLALIGLNTNEADLAKANLAPNATLGENGKMIIPEDESGQMGTSSFNVDSNALTGWAGAFQTWAGGMNVWSGGLAAWAGAWSNWSSGSGVPALPSVNRAHFDIVNVPQAQAISSNFGSGITVAVIDSGIDLNHPMFQGRLSDPSTWADFVGANPNNDGTLDDYLPQEEGSISDRGYGHGTGVAGAIAQVAPKAKIMPIRVIQKDGSASFADIAAAVDWATTHGANVINMSFGAARDNTVTYSELGSVSAFVMAATNKKVFTVASSGNAGVSQAVYPAMLGNKAAFRADVVSALGTIGGTLLDMTNPYDERYVLSVGSVDKYSAMSSFSNYGAGVEFYANGESIASAAPALTAGGAGGAAKFTGTSFAAPQVTGMLALALSDAASTMDKGTIPANLLGTSSVSSGKVSDSLNAMKTTTSKRRTALFIAATTTLSAADSSMVSNLQNWGYTVTTIAQSAKLADAAGKDLVVISSSVDSKAVGEGWANATMPVLVCDEGMFSKMKMTSAAGATSSTTSLNIVNSDYPTAAGLDTGTQAVYTAANTASYGVPAASAFVVAQLANGKAAIFSYNKDDQMVGMVAPARRVGFFASGTAAANFTNTGKRLFKAAVTWATTGN